jgi:hypothetical protein
MFRSPSELCKTELDRRFMEDGRLLKCGPPGTDNKDEPLEIKEDAKALWLKFKFVQFGRKWVEADARRSILESEQNVEQQSSQNAPSFITMPSVVRNVLNKPCLFTLYIPTCSCEKLFYFYLFRRQI